MKRSKAQAAPRKAAPAAAAAPALFDDAANDAREPDLVTAFFDVLVETRPDLAAVREIGEQAVRARLRGMRGTVTDRPDPDTLARRVLELFNGRNPREVARRLRVSRGTVYRVLKQAGR